MEKVSVFWFRRDLRLDDNRGLYEALKGSENVLPLFIFDEDILDTLPVDDHRVTFIHSALSVLHAELRKSGSGLLVKKGEPFSVFAKLLDEYDIDAVYCNGDHEPYGLTRDEKIRALLASRGISFFSYTDHLIFDKTEVLKPDGTPYVVYTPYSKQWKNLLTQRHLKTYSSEEHLGRCFKSGNHLHFPDLQEIGFINTSIPIPAQSISESLIRSYDKTRDFPAMDGTSRLGIQLRFGTLSIRRIIKLALEWNESFLNELIWREFYAMILWHFPHVIDKSFRAVYDNILWRNDESDFERWMTGSTGYPMVDAGMRQLNATGYMHNRLRMITASFLTKHLLIDWRWGEIYFAGKLFDFELSSNNGGWQWSAGTGCDAAPYFRIFNPTEQQKKFDSEGSFIRQWIPELESSGYPLPMVDHKHARERCLMVYKSALSQQ